MPRKPIASPSDPLASLVDLPLETVSLAALHPHPRNPVTHPEAQLAHIRHSLEEYGYYRNIVVAADNTILAGHGVVEAARSLGWAEAPVRRMALAPDDPAAIRLVIGDNYQAQLRVQEDTVLAAMLQELAALDIDALVGTGFDADTLALLAGTVAPEGGMAGPGDDAEPQIDRAEKLREQWGVEVGQLWTLGEHRVICGDCTETAVVERMMEGEMAHMIFTDPPYGVDYDGGMKKHKRLENDMVGTDIYSEALPVLASVVDPQAALYLWYADAHVAAAAAAAAGYVIVAQIIWAKNHAQFMSSAHYHGKHEPCFYAHKRGKTARWYGPTNEVTLWECDRAPSNDYHPTQKPIPLALRAMTNSTAPGDCVLDGFLGGGTTLIACEQLGRQCRGIEIDPGYVAVTLQRWHDVTGQFPQLLA